MTIWALLAASLTLQATDTLYQDLPLLCYSPALSARYCVLEFENPQGCINGLRQYCREQHPSTQWPWEPLPKPEASKAILGQAKSWAGLPR